LHTTNGRIYDDNHHSAHFRYPVWHSTYHRTPASHTE
jgi:hypothetical protein